MPSLSRSQAERRGAADGGDDADIVYPSETRSNSSRPTYHDDPECQYRAGDADQLTREAAQRKWYVPCKRCVAGVGDDG